MPTFNKDGSERKPRAKKINDGFVRMFPLDKAPFIPDMPDGNKSSFIIGEGSPQFQITAPDDPKNRAEFLNTLLGNLTPDSLKSENAIDDLRTAVWREILKCQVELAADDSYYPVYVPVSWVRHLVSLVRIMTLDDIEKCYKQAKVAKSTPPSSIAPPTPEPPTPEPEGLRFSDEITKKPKANFNK